ncbi:MAG: hypothetical protein MUF31_11570 [Akkermansiaceae bacterium]|jgi:autotransporter-associated beta strand protein|nr:hypothetical protein [Akkermansiaceae bacterium]
MHPLLAYSILSIFVAHAAEITWTGSADQEWLNPANWSSQPALPVEGSNATADTLWIDSPSRPAVFDAADGTRNYRSIRVGFNADGRLDITGGILSGQHTIQTMIGRAGHHGIMNLSGDGQFRSGHITQVGLDAGSIGEIHQSGGTFTIFRGAAADSVPGETSLHLGPGGSGLYQLSAGSLFTRFGVVVGSTTPGSSGRFHVTGSSWNATIGGNNGINPANHGFWVQRANGTLAATIDSSNFSLSTLHIHHATGSFLTFEAGSLLDTGFTGHSPTTPMSWDLIRFDNNATLTDLGLTLHPYDIAAGWSFEWADSDADPRPDTLRLHYSPPVANAAITVHSLAELREVAAIDHLDVTLAPGTYWLSGPAVKPSPVADHPIFLDLAASHSNFDFTGVTFLVDTRDLRGYGRAFGHSDTVRVFQISGDHTTAKGLDLEVVNVAYNGNDAWGRPREFTADWSTTLVELIGSHISLLDCTFTTRGSFPYGYGDAFGKGTRPTDANGVTNAAWIDHRKHNGIRIGRGANDVTLENITLNMRSFGHGIFLQEGASDVTLRHCSVLGDEMADSDDIIAHPVYQQWGFATYREKIPADIRISKHEDGIRVYINSNSATNGWPEFVHNLTIENCNIERMRDALATGDMTGDLHVTQTSAWECEQGFTPSNIASSNTFLNCRGDARNGPLVFFRRSASNVTLECELAGTQPPRGTWPIALISGTGNDITLTRSAPAGLYPSSAHVLVSQRWREWRHRPEADLDSPTSNNVASPSSNGTIHNQTGQTLVLGTNTSGMTGSSDAPVINKGSNNIYTATTLIPPALTGTDTWGEWFSHPGETTVISAATLGGANPLDGGTVIADGGTLILSPGLSITGESITLSGAGKNGQGALFSHGLPGNGTRWGVNDSTSTITLAGNSTIHVGTAGNQLLIGEVEGSGNLTKSGPGLLVMENGPNSFAGDLILAAGSISARTAKVPQNLIIHPGTHFGQQANLALDQDPGETTTVDGTLDLNRRGPTDTTPHQAVIGRLLGGPTGTITATSSAATHSVEITGNDQASDFSGSLTGSISLRKSGSALLRLRGNSSHLGETRILQGTLDLLGSFSQSPLFLASGAVLTGSGSTQGALTLESGAIFRPGTGIDRFTSGPQTWHDGAVIEIDLAQHQGSPGAAWDHLEIAGTLAIAPQGGTPLVRIIALPGSFDDFDPRSPRTWTLATATDVIATSLPALEISSGPSLPEGGTFTLVTTPSALTLQFTPSAFSSWKLLHDIPAATPADADPDLNGISLLLEYATGITPGGNATPLIIIPGPSGPSARFFRAAVDVRYDIYSSSDLVSWQLLGSDPGSVGSTVEIPLPQTSMRHFVRLHATLATP